MNTDKIYSIRKKGTNKYITRDGSNPYFSGHLRYIDLLTYTEALRLYRLGEGEMVEVQLVFKSVQPHIHPDE